MNIGHCLKIFRAFFYVHKDFSFRFTGGANAFLSKMMFFFSISSILLKLHQNTYKIKHISFFSIILCFAF